MNDQELERIMGEEIPCDCCDERPRCAANGLACVDWQRYVARGAATVTSVSAFRVPTKARMDRIMHDDDDTIPPLVPVWAAEYLAPCPCGSGKTYGWCHQDSANAESAMRYFREGGECVN